MKTFYLDLPLPRWESGVVSLSNGIEVRGKIPFIQPLRDCLAPFGGS
jgi:hypothetical protein